ncbi:MAG: two-component sensor histidine kinase [Burkholderiales bacterium PBB5]|nr:MAG: two-component sensor histidine kinase [Burkholderiales bacterium PBB5]
MPLPPLSASATATATNAASVEPALRLASPTRHAAPALTTRTALTHTPPAAWALGAVAWGLGWGVLLLAGTRLDLANQALLLVLAGALAALWLPAPAALLAALLAVAAFNWTCVPPRGTFAVDSPQNALLLAAMAGVLTVLVAVVARLRAQARAAQHLQLQAEQLRQLGDVLRQASAPLPHAGSVQQALATLMGCPATLLLRRDGQGTPTPDATLLLGEANADELAGLWHALRQGQAMGPGCGHHTELPCWYLPLRGGGAASPGVALLRLPLAGRDNPPLREHAQALCDQLGQALQRQFSALAEAQAQAQAHTQAVRNALLAAISHDYRTPLATILGAASSLADQAERLDPVQRRRLADSIVQEVTQLSRMTDNTLQLARLDAPGVVLRLDWESAEEIIGTVLHRARRRAPERKLRARLEPGLPLLRCDALLLTQLLDNLVDNALKHTADDVPVELLVRREGQQLVLAVRDRGPGVPPAWRERIFDAFQRGDAPADAPLRPGSGVGLAVCRAIARAHGGELRLRPRSHGGSSFECSLPLADTAPPPAAPEAQ